MDGGCMVDKNMKVHVRAYTFGGLYADHDTAYPITVVKNRWKKWVKKYSNSPDASKHRVTLTNLASGVKYKISAKDPVWKRI